MYSLFYYIAQMLSVLKLCLRIFCQITKYIIKLLHYHITSLRRILFYHISELFPKKTKKYTLSHYIAEPNLKDKVVYCNNLLSIKAAFLGEENTTFTVATLAPMFTMITPGPYTCITQTETVHVKCNLEANCDEKYL